MSTLNARQLPEERLSTTDEKGARVYIHPAEVRGRYKKRRDLVHAFLVLLFLALPWVKIAGHPAVLLDIPHRRFALFGLTFWAHDAPILLFLFVGGALAIGFVTALWGRLWCGWACPQTVFIEGVFRRIERWLEGDAVARRRLQKAPWDADKTLKKVTKWLSFLLVSLVITHSFLAYFVGTDALLRMVQSSPVEHPASFIFMGAATALILFDFGWFREQFCTIVCPYGRFQSVLMDDHSLVVAYDTHRGEPRRGSVEPEGKEGDCVNCYRCVDVCPTGIDIRRGLQMECIACTACIDACDEIMEKLKRPRGLIRYDSFQGLQGEKPKGILRPRALAYLILLLLAAGGLAFTVIGREGFDAAFLRAKDSPYQQISDPERGPLVINHYQVDLANQGFEEIRLVFALDPAFQDQGIELITPLSPLPLKPGLRTRADLFIKFPQALLSGGKLTIRVVVSAESEKAREETKGEEITLLGPYR